MRVRLFPVLALAAALAFSARPSQARIFDKGVDVSVGRETASAVEHYYRVDADPVSVARVRQVGRRLAACAADPDYPFEFHVVEDPEVNAFALPGGFVYIYRGLLQILPNDDALASVLAHEISHVTRRHAMRQFEKSIVLAAGIEAILRGTGAGGGAGDAAQVVQAIVGITFTRHDEADADENGIALLAKAGYNPRAAAEAMQVLKRAVGKDRTPALLRTHPAPDSRIRKLTAMADEILTHRETARAAAPAPPPAPVAPKRALAGLDALEVEACEWFPLATGARWAYRVKGDGAETRAVVRVLERIEAEPAGVYRVEYEVGSGIKTTRLVAPAGDRYVSRGEGTAAPGEWRQEAVFGPKADAPLTDGLFRYAGVERVTVPAGEFEAAKVERLGPDGMAESVSWYVRDVGLVKRLTLSTGAVQELTGYTIPETKR